MGNKDCTPRGFFFRPEFAEIGKEILSEEQYKDYLVALVELGCCWKLNLKDYEKDPYICLCLHQVIPSMNATDRRYVLAKKNGKRGGRKRSFTDRELIEAITELGLTTQKELAEHFDCHVRTIARRVKPSKVAEVYHNRKKLSALKAETHKGGVNDEGPQ